VETHESGPLEAETAPPAVKPAAEAKRCLECKQPLAPGDRKVHRGACQRARKTRLQYL